MADEYQLTAPTSAKTFTQDELAKGRDLLDRVSRLAVQRQRSRVKLEAWSFRIPIKLHDDLRRLSKEYSKTHPELAMSEIVVGLLQVYVPVMLASCAAPEQTESPQQAELRSILGRLTEILGPQGIDALRTVSK
jgi:hypothetical protein